MTRTLSKWSRPEQLEVKQITKMRSKLNKRKTQRQSSRRQTKAWSKYRVEGKSRSSRLCHHHQLAQRVVPKGRGQIETSSPLILVLVLPLQTLHCPNWGDFQIASVTSLQSRHLKLLGLRAQRRRWQQQRFPSKSHRSLITSIRLGTLRIGSV